MEQRAQIQAIVDKGAEVQEILKPSDLEVFANYPWAFGSNPVPLHEGLVMCAPEPTLEKRDGDRPRLTIA